MNRRAAAGLSILLLPACGEGPSPEPPPAAVVESVPPAGVNEPTPVLPVDAETGASCGDGRDNDRDGLLDCEEAACAFEPPCAEVCGNGEDDDDNGLTDELDDLCWTSHAASARVTARVNGGGAIHHRWSSLLDSYNRGWVGNVVSSSNRALSLDSAWGTAQVTTAASGVFACTWGASGIGFGWETFHRFVWMSSSSTRVSSSGAIPVTRSLSWVDSGCPVPASSFLPTALKTSATGQFAASSSGSIVGRRWYVAAFPYFGGRYSVERSQASWGRYRRTERYSTMTGELRQGDPVQWAP